MACLKVTLREGSSSVFASDCTANLRRLLREKSKGLRADEDAACRVCQKALVHGNVRQVDEIMPVTDVHCLSGITEKKPARPGEIILFFCGHYFHQPCLEARLKEITDYYSKRKKSTPKGKYGRPPLGTWSFCFVDGKPVTEGLSSSR